MLIEQYQELLPEYRQYNLTEKGIEEITLKLYLCNVEKFLEYLDFIYVNPPKKLEYINESHVMDFLKFKEEKHKSSTSTLDRYYRNIKYFFGFLLEKRYIKAPILENGHNYEVNFRPKRADFFTRDELKNIIKTSKNKYDFKKDFFSFRDYIIITLLCYSGMTVGELINLKERDVNILSMKLTISKQRGRIVYLNKDLCILLKDYVLAKNKYKITEYLFPSKYNKQLTTRWVEKMINNIATEAGIDIDERSISPKAIRNTFVRMIIDDIGDLAVAARITGLDIVTLTDYIEEDTPETDIKAEEFLNKNPLF